MDTITGKFSTESWANVTLGQKCNFEEAIKSLGNSDYDELNNSEDSINFKVKRLAADVVLTFLGDILTAAKITHYVRMIINERENKQNKSFAKLLLKKHAAATKWFCSGEALSSNWFKYLGMQNIGQDAVMAIVHKKIEGHISDYKTNE